MACKVNCPHCAFVQEEEVAIEKAEQALLDQCRENNFSPEEYELLFDVGMTGVVAYREGKGGHWHSDNCTNNGETTNDYIDEKSAADDLCAFIRNGADLDDLALLYSKYISDNPVKVYDPGVGGVHTDNPAESDQFKDGVRVSE